MSNFDWSSFTKNISIYASCEKIYNAFATRAGMESWFLRVCEYEKDERVLDDLEAASLGTKYYFLWHGWSDAVDDRGSILYANGKDKFAFSFDANGSTTMKVVINIEQKNDHCIVSLKQYDIDTDDNSKSHYHIGCGDGWVFYLTNLKSILEGGIDLRNKDLEIQGVVNA